MPGLDEQLSGLTQEPVEQAATSNEKEAIPGVSKLHASLGKRTQERDEAMRERDTLRERLAALEAVGQAELAREEPQAPQQQQEATTEEYEEGDTFEVVNGQLVQVEPPQVRGQNAAREFRQREELADVSDLSRVFNH